MTHTLINLETGRYKLDPADKKWARIISTATGRRLAKRRADGVAFMLQVPEGDTPIIDATYVRKTS